MKSKISRKYYPLALAVIAVCVFLTTFALNRTEKADQPEVSDTSMLTFVKTNPELSSHLIHYKGMDVNFNADYHVPNWVVWELTGEETKGKVPRSNKFYADPPIKGCPEPSNYTYSGYDRGHMAPAGDMKWDREAMEETFCLTNIAPQAKKLNVGAWKKLEEKCRNRAVIDSAIIIVCGPILNEEPIQYIGQERVAVPKRFFKVILSPYTNPVRGIGFIMPNGEVRGGMQACATTIDEVERITGHDFFSSLPDEIENRVESECNFHTWSNLKSTK